VCFSLGYPALGASVVFTVDEHVTWECYQCVNRDKPLSRVCVRYTSTDSRVCLVLLGDRDAIHPGQKFIREASCNAIF